jgi:hypothetical protein
MPLKVKSLARLTTFGGLSKFGVGQDANYGFLRMKYRFVIHPFFFAAYPVIALLAHNIEWATIADSFRSLVTVIAFAGLLLLILKGLVKDIDKAALICSLAVVLFFSYGHIYQILKTSDVFSALGRHRYMIPTWILVFVLGGWWIYRTRLNLRSATTTLNIIAVATLIIPIFTITQNQILSVSGRATAREIQDQTVDPLQLPADGNAPDIYYIILDAYGRADLLEEVFNFDNTPFLEFLDDKGFYIGKYSLSNYAQTSLSIASSTNMNFLQDLIPDLDPNDTTREALWNLIQHSKIRTALEAIGYKTVAFPTGLSGTDLQDADVYYSAGRMDEIVSLSAVTPFESMLVYNSAGLIVTDGFIVLPSFFPDLNYPYEVRRARTLNAFDRLSDIPDLEGPHFVFAHIIAPHPPFVFDRDGNPVEPNQPFSLGFAYGTYRPEQLETWVEGYAEQLAFVNKRLQQIIEDILATSDTPPIIILQADHGPKAETKVPYTHERLAILNAYYLPGGGTDLLYPSISPVNSFRIVFNHYFGGKFDLLEDRSFWSQYSRPYEFKEEFDEIDYYPKN